MVTFTETHARAALRALLTRRAVRWGTNALTDDDTTIVGTPPPARRRLAHAGGRSGSRFAEPTIPTGWAGIELLGVGEDIWRPGKFGQGREVTCMVDLTRHANGQVRARLLDLVLGRSRPANGGWMDARQPEFRAQTGSAALKPLRGYATPCATVCPMRCRCWDAFHRRQARPAGRRRGPPPGAAGAARPARTS